MAINSKKSCCLRIGQMHNNPCAPLCTLFGDLTSWVDELRYLGVIIMRSRAFTCSLHHAKKLFYRSANAIFGEVGRIINQSFIAGNMAHKNTQKNKEERHTHTHAQLQTTNLYKKGY